MLDGQTSQASANKENAVNEKEIQIMKRIVTLGFIVTLSFVLLIGCGGNNGVEETNGATSTAGETAIDSDGASNDAAPDTGVAAGETTDNSDDASNDAAPGAGVTAVVSPPAWLIGEWTPADPVLDGQDILVTDNNVVFSSGILDIEWQVKNAGFVVEESLDGEAYTLSYEAGGIVTTYIFKNQRNNAMLLQFGMGGTLQDMDFIKK